MQNYFMMAHKRFGKLFHLLDVNYTNWFLPHSYHEYQCIQLNYHFEVYNDKHLL